MLDRLGEPARRDAVIVRTAEHADAAALIAIRSSVVDPDFDTDEFVHHLGIPHGDDYFCLAAEVAGAVAGYLSAGGSRDEDHKSFGEFYELAAAPTEAGCPVREALCAAAFSQLVEAQYGGVIASIPDAGGEQYRSILVGFGFTPDDYARDHREGQRRYGVVLLPPTRTVR